MQEMCSVYMKLSLSRNYEAYLLPFLLLSSFLFATYFYRIRDVLVHDTLIRTCLVAVVRRISGRLGSSCGVEYGYGASKGRRFLALIACGEKFEYVSTNVQVLEIIRSYYSNKTLKSSS